MGVKFKTHEVPEGHTRDVVIRVSEIDNGYVIKAGGPPHHVTTAAELREKVDEILAGFTSTAIAGRPLGAPASLPDQMKARSKRRQ